MFMGAMLGLGSLEHNYWRGEPEVMLNFCARIPRAKLIKQVSNSALRKSKDRVILVHCAATLVVFLLKQLNGISHDYLCIDL